MGLSPKDIATRLGVNRSSVTRWMASGKLESTRDRTARPDGSLKPPPRPPKTPSEWAADVRATYDLDATDDQLVTVAEGALTLSLDEKASPQVRLQSAGRFQSIVKQLALVARSAVAEPGPVPGKPDKPTFRVVRRRDSGDPRRALMAVSE
jgi:hypothetical protein